MPEKVGGGKISIDSDRQQFIKRFNAEDLEFQIAKENRLSEIFADSKKIKVPQLIRNDSGSSELTYEYIEDLVSFRSLLRDRALATDLAERVGRGIARAHQQLDLPESFKVRLPGPYGNFTSENAFLHLDLSTVNVQYSRSRDCVYLIDWQLSPLFRSNSTYGSIYFDLSFFSSNLFMVEPYVLTHAKFKTSLLRLLLKGYESIYGKLNLDEFEKVGMCHFNERSQLERRKLKEFACWVNHANYKAFIKKLQTIMS